MSEVVTVELVDPAYIGPPESMRISERCKVVLVSIVKLPPIQIRTGEWVKL